MFLPVADDAGLSLLDLSGLFPSPEMMPHPAAAGISRDIQARFRASISDNF